MVKNSCDTCHNPTDSQKTLIRNGKVIKGCPSCLPQLLQQGDSAAHVRKYQQAEYRKDLTQPNQRDFVKAYGAETARKYGYDDDTIRRLS